MINFPDIPRFYTALTESLACLLVCSSLVLSEKWSRKQFRILLIFLIQILLQLVAGKLPCFFGLWEWASISLGCLFPFDCLELSTGGLASI